MTRINDYPKDNPAVRDQKKIDISKSPSRSNDPARSVKTPFETFLTESKSRLSPDQHSSDPNLDTKKGATEQAIREASRDREGKDQERKFKERDRDRSAKREEKPSEITGQKAKVAEKKVIARSALTGKTQRDTTGGGRESMSQGQKKGRSFGEIISRSLVKKPEGKLSPVGQGPSSFSLKASGEVKPTPGTNPTQLSKEVLDQIVQYVRILTKPGGEKEMEVALHQNIYRGLKLKVSSAQGKLRATFTTSSSEVRQLFESNRKVLQAALAQKGIEVEGIDVIMTP
ncbi:MAG: flagellar hook-length control protein FliK [Deltaproteobacteria bacterium]|nr:flagellar hook-length control protein FliK [Deltaproteobacteria bacterium]